MTLSPAYLQNGEEQWEPYFSQVLNRQRIQYDFRDHEGHLFSCISDTVDECRRRRDKWVLEKAH